MIVARICDIESGKCGEWKSERMIMDDIFNGVGVDERVQTVQVVDLTIPVISIELGNYASDRIDFIYRHGNLELLKSYGQED